MESGEQISTNTTFKVIFCVIEIGSFPFVPQPPHPPPPHPPTLVLYAPPDTENVPLHSKLLCKNMARASGGGGGGGGVANNMHPLSWGGGPYKLNQ